MTSLPSLQYNPETLAVPIPVNGHLDLRPFQIVSLFFMYQFYASLFVELAQFIGSVIAEREPLSQEQKEAWLKQLLNLGEHCEKAGLKVSDGHITNIVYDIDRNPNLPDDQFKQRLKALVDSLVIELDGTLFLHVPFANAISYNKPFEKWEKIVERFPNTVRDIEEAQKCLAAIALYGGSVS